MIFVKYSNSTSLPLLLGTILADIYCLPNLLPMNEFDEKSNVTKIFSLRSLFVKKRSIASRNK